MKETMMEFTLYDLKEMMPIMDMQVNKKIYKAVIGGRKNKFASVVANIDGVVVRYEFAWATILHALNTSTPLTV